MADTRIHKYPKRLIEVDLPIRTISEEGAREKATRQGNISTMHLWWARRPLAACRAVTLAALLPDPDDSLCPETFRKTAASTLTALRATVGGQQRDYVDGLTLRNGLIDFTRAISNHENARNPVYLTAARALVESAHQSLRRDGTDSRPLVADPFAGGGTIPFESLRLGANAFASDLNPVAGTVNRVLLEDAPRHGERLKRGLTEAAEKVRDAARKRLASGYSQSRDTRQPVAYLWVRWVVCEGPACGAVIPLSRSRCLLKRGKRRVAFAYTKAKGGWDFSIKEPASDEDMAGTVRQGHALCPVCGFTTRKDRVRAQLATRRGGTNDALLVAIAESAEGERGRLFRAPTSQDLAANTFAKATLDALVKTAPDLIPCEAVPHERVWKNNPIRVHLYGMAEWRDLFSPRQALALATLCQESERVVDALRTSLGDASLADAIGACLALALDRTADHLNSLCTWNPTEPKLQHLFGRQAIPFVWDFAEADPFGNSVGDWSKCVESVVTALETAQVLQHPGSVRVASATRHPLPDDSVDAVITDPPYYDAVPYATLADFFYVWLKRSLPPAYVQDFGTDLSPKDDECVVDDAKGKGAEFFERTMRDAMAEARRITRPEGIAVVVFAHKTTAGWEALLQAILNAGWVVTASWPIGTEMATRLRARDSAALGSSIHLVLRPRAIHDDSVEDDTVGDWRVVLRTLPVRIREWLPRLAQEGVVGADAIFACLGPALEVFSRYSRVEKISGERVELREYLEQVWAAVSREALTMIFEAADTSGLEADARVTAMWLWTIASSSKVGSGVSDDLGDEVAAEDGESEEKAMSAAQGGFALEYDAARKIAQGLGARLEEMGHVIELKAGKARLLAVVERTKLLFGKVDGPSATTKKTSKKSQMALFGELDHKADAQGWGEAGAPKAGTTALDRVHQAMLLFGAGRGEALRRFIVDEGVGKQAPFWRLAQSLSALYPSGSDEKRWVDGVLARKKGLGFG